MTKRILFRKKVSIKDVNLKMSLNQRYDCHFFLILLIQRLEIDQTPIALNVGELFIFKSQLILIYNIKYKIIL